MFFSLFFDEGRADLASMIFNLLKPKVILNVLLLFTLTFRLLGEHGVNDVYNAMSTLRMSRVNSQLKVLFYSAFFAGVTADWTQSSKGKPLQTLLEQFLLS